MNFLDSEYKNVLSDMNFQNPEGHATISPNENQPLVGEPPYPNAHYSPHMPLQPPPQSISPSNGPFHYSAGVSQQHPQLPPHNGSPDAVQFESLDGHSPGIPYNPSQRYAEVEIQFQGNLQYQQRTPMYFQPYPQFIPQHQQFMPYPNSVPVTPAAGVPGPDAHYYNPNMIMPGDHTVMMQLHPNQVATSPLPLSPDNIPMVDPRRKRRRVGEAKDSEAVAGVKLQSERDIESREDETDIGKIPDNSIYGKEKGKPEDKQPGNNGEQMDQNDKEAENERHKSNSTEASEGNKEEKSPKSRFTSKEDRIGHKLTHKRIKPCEQCQKRRAKCIISPTATRCMTCISRGVNCSFEESPRDFEAIPGAPWMPGSSKTGYSESKISQLSNVPQVEASMLKETLSLQYPRSSYYMGPTSIIDPRMFSYSSDSSILNITQDLYIRKTHPSVFFSLETDFTKEVFKETIHRCDDIEKLVAPHGPSLINAYFDKIHPTIPILHKSIFREKYERTAREFSPSLLAAVYSLGISAMMFSNDPEMEEIDPSLKGKLTKLARENFACISHKPKLSTVQAGLLLLQCTPTSQGNWVLFSQVLAAAEELGLGLPCADWSLPEWEKSLRKRIAWWVYVQDKWLALSLGRPGRITNENWMIEDLELSDLPDEETEAEKSGRKGFIEMVELTRVLNKLQKYYSFRSLLDPPMGLRDYLKLILEELAQVNRSTELVELSYYAVQFSVYRLINNLSPAELEKAKKILNKTVEFIATVEPANLCVNFCLYELTLVGSFAMILFWGQDGQSNDFDREVFKEMFDNYKWVISSKCKGDNDKTTNLFAATYEELRMLELVGFGGKSN